jgi:hypothetical protein
MRTQMRLRMSFVIAMAFAPSLWAADPAVGTWKVNLEKSRLRDPAEWKGRIMIVEPVGARARRITIIDAGKDGQTTKREDLRLGDGEERPDKLNPGRTIISERIDAWTSRTTWKEAGKPVKIIVSAVSLDGNEMTNYVIGSGDKGSIYQEKRVFDRQ